MPTRSLALCLLMLPACATPPQATAVDPGNAAQPDPGIDATLNAVYDVISGPVGEARDWDRFRDLFVEGARLIPTGATPQGGFGMRVMTPEDYIDFSGDFLVSQGFFEQEVHRVVDRFGPIAQVFSTYEARHSLDDAEPFMSGINSIQLFFDGNRWRVVSIFWSAASPAQPIPAAYRP